MLIEFAGPEKDMEGFCQTEERRKEAVNLIVALNGCLFVSVQTTYRNTIFGYWLS